MEEHKMPKQIDEISKDLAKSYKKGAQKDRRNTERRLKRSEDNLADIGTKNPRRMAGDDHYDKDSRRSDKRASGISKATKRINENLDQSKEIKDMLDNMIAGKASDVQQNFNDLMQDRTNQQMDTVKVDISKQMFHPQSVAPEGIPIDGEPLELVDIDQTTGVPVDTDETTDENV